MPRPIGRIAQVDHQATTRFTPPSSTVPKPSIVKPVQIHKSLGLKPPPTTKSGITTVNGIKITILGDNIDNSIGDANTNLQFKRGVQGYEYSGPKKIITKLVGPSPIIKATIQTSYNSGAKPSDSSAYGRGTTTEDKRTGNISLGFHESCHRSDYISYIKAHVPPVFSGKIGISEDQYKLATENYFQAVDDYLAACLKFSEDQTDEVGSPTKTEYLAKHKR